MTKEEFKETVINYIINYVIGAVNNDFVEEEMIGVNKGVYIAPATSKEEPWYEQGCEVTWKDSEGKTVKKAYLTLDAYADDFGDLVMNGRRYVEDIAKEIYREIFEE